MSGRIKMDNGIAKGAISITPSDTVEYNGFNVLYVGSDGDVAVVAKESDSIVVLKNVKGGTILPLFVKAVAATNTTATDLVLLS